MILSENPTPEEVRDFYDLHTAEGAANFSHTGGGFAVQLWHSLAWALEDKAQLEAELEMYERGETFGTLAIQLAELEEENAALKREVKALIDSDRWRGLSALEPYINRLRALLADTLKERMRYRSDSIYTIRKEK